MQKSKIPWLDVKASSETEAIMLLMIVCENQQVTIEDMGKAIRKLSDEIEEINLDIRKLYGSV